MWSWEVRQLLSCWDHLNTGCVVTRGVCVTSRAVDGLAHTSVLARKHKAAPCGCNRLIQSLFWPRVWMCCDYAVSSRFLVGCSPGFKEFCHNLPRSNVFWGQLNAGPQEAAPTRQRSLEIYMAKKGLSQGSRGPYLPSKAVPVPMFPSRGWSHGG